MILLDRVSKRFLDRSGERGIFELSLEIKEGESCLLRGPSGSGKSTLLSLISGIARPSNGEVSIQGKHLSLMSDHFATRFRLLHIGFIFQKFHLIPDMSVFENVALALVPLNLSSGELDRRVFGILERFLMKEKAFSLAKDLSGGEQQRVAIARALVNEPMILLADEPTANLDPSLKKEFLRLLGELKEERRTLLVASHDRELLEGGFFDRQIELSEGRLA